MTYAFEPDTAAYLARFAAQPARENQSLDDLRASYRANLVSDSVKLSSGLKVHDLLIPGSEDAMAARLYVPEQSGGPRPLLVYVHGGGFAVGDIQSHDGLARLIATVGGLSVLTFEYGRAPEHPFPAGRDDAVAVYRWAAEHAIEFGFDPARIAIGGESAGAAHAVAAALTLRDACQNPAAIWVMSPALDATTSGESFEAFATGAGRTSTEFTYLWSLYVPNAIDQIAASPGLANPTALAPLFVYTAEFDPARDDGETFAAKARITGVPVVLKRRAGLIHQYPEMTGVSAAARMAVEDAARELAAALTGPYGSLRSLPWQRSHGP